MVVVSPLEHRLEQVQGRAVYLVFRNKWEPELVSVHWTETGAKAKVEHLLSPATLCEDEGCYTDHDSHVFVSRVLVET